MEKADDLRLTCIASSLEQKKTQQFLFGTRVMPIYFNAAI